MMNADSVQREHGRGTALFPEIPRMVIGQAEYVEPGRTKVLCVTRR